MPWRDAALLVGFVDAWRAADHRKHIALKHALTRAERRLRASGSADKSARLS
jgi:hypothetical protein